MDVHGFHIVSEPTDQNESGFSTTVADATGTVRGPFQTVKEAIDCAHSWNAENGRDALKQIENAAPTEQPENNEQPAPTETQ